MTALLAAPVARVARPAPTPRFEIGDRVLVEPNGQEGLIVGVRYGAPAYDVRVNGVCLRNLPPERVRLAPEGAREVVRLRRTATDNRDFLF